MVQDRLAQFETEVTGLRGLCRDLVERNEAGTAGPADASIVKLYYSELLQRMTDFGAEVGGLAAQTVLAKPMSSGWESGAWVLDFIGSWEWTIPGGASEIQRTIIGERGSRPAPGTEWRVTDGTRIRRAPRRTAAVAARPARPRTGAGATSAGRLAEAGWLGLEVPERARTAPAPPSPRSAVICEEMGRAAAPAPYLGGAVLGVGALKALVEPSETR